jgi:hypothetical protein
MEAAPQSQSAAHRPSSSGAREAGPDGVFCSIFSGWIGNPTVVLALAAGLFLRLWMLRKYFQPYGDALLYGDLAKNLLRHGSYAFSGVNDAMAPTLIRLPGYPIFLALCFQLFGMENYVSAAWVQIGLELLGCLLLADFARRIASRVPGAGSPVCERAARITLWLAALCPFTAIYAAEPVSEAPTLFVLALALWAAERFGARPRWSSALWFTLAITFAALLRPDGALVGVALVPALFFGPHRKLLPAKKLARMAVVCLLLALLPFAGWTWRNWKTFHVIQPLAPRYANDPDEDPHVGWIRWVESWCLDFVSTYQIYWTVPGEPLKVKYLPERAFDSPRQRAETLQLIDEYNRGNLDISPEQDARFAQLADERARTHPLRSHLWLPLGRLADMIFRPRVENLPIDLDWWVYSRHRAETRFCWAYTGLNALYLLLGVAGLCLRPRLWRWMLAYLVLRCALLMTVEAPEARYTLEFFPIWFAAGGIALATAWHRMRRKQEN